MTLRDQDGAVHQVGGDPFEGWAEAGVDPIKPNIARVYDYLLGAHHNLVADRQVAEAMTILVSQFSTCVSNLGHRPEAAIPLPPPPNGCLLDRSHRSISSRAAAVARWTGP
jgi:hypothetical protein